MCSWHRAPAISPHQQSKRLTTQLTTPPLQKINLNPSCKYRGVLAAVWPAVPGVICPKFELVTVVLQLVEYREYELKMLNHSARNWNFRRSVKLNIFESDISGTGLVCNRMASVRAGTSVGA